jgi:hypothetical protein
MNIDLSTSVSYLSVLPAQALSANTNSAAVNLFYYHGKVAVQVVTGSGSGTNPVLTGYFMTSATTNISQATNLIVTSFNTGVNASNSNPLSLISTFTTNGTNQVQVFGVDVRLANQYLFLVTTIAGANASIPAAVTLCGMRQFETA